MASSWVKIKTKWSQLIVILTHKTERTKVFENKQTARQTDKQIHEGATQVNETPVIKIPKSLVSTRVSVFFFFLVAIMGTLNITAMKSSKKTFSLKQIHEKKSFFRLLTCYIPVHATHNVKHCQNWDGWPRTQG